MNYYFLQFWIFFNDFRDFADTFLYKTEKNPIIDTLVFIICYFKLKVYRSAIF